MNKEEILEFNKLCAEFLGYKYFPYPNADAGWRKEQGHLKLSEYYLARTTKDLEFHSDWNYMMRVVDSIETLQTETSTFEFHILPKYVIIREDKNYSFEKEDGGRSSQPLRFNGSFSIVGKTKKEAVVKAIYGFLKYYNNGKTD